MSTVDLNADVGEGCGSDDALLELVSSASIACGAHAGGGRTMQMTIEAALARGVSIGAHPGYRDLASFGRKETGATPGEIRDLVLSQLEEFGAACARAGAIVRYVKPHGAMYNRAMLDEAAAESIARAVAEFDSSLTILAMPGGALLASAAAVGLRTAREAFLDREYVSALTLVPRAAAGAVIDDPLIAAARAEQIVIRASVTATDGTELTVSADSLCVHGDNSHAVGLLRAARARLESAGVSIRAFSAA